jgi:DNA-binding SARP family transcriptional activator/tetratricopeptide (TPR) repeat protein
LYDPVVDVTSMAILTLIGPFALRVGGCDVTGLPRKAQALIAFLAMQPGRRVSREVVADLLWTQSGPDQARHSLRQMLVVLRRTPAGDLIQANADELWIEAGTVTVDALALEACLADPDGATVSSCVSHVQGGLLENLPAISPGFDEWLRPERARFASAMAQNLRRRVAGQLMAGGYDAAIETASRLVGMDTLDEAAHRLLIEGLARAGRRSEALQQFEICADTLLTELDVAPDAETVALVDCVRAGNWPPKVTAPASKGDSPIQSAASEAADIATEPAAVFPTPGPRARPWRKGFVWAAVLLGIITGSAGVFALRQPAAHSPGVLVSDFRSISGAPIQGGMVAGLDVLVKVSLSTQHHVRLIENPAGSAVSTGPDGGPSGPNAVSRYLLEGSASFETNKLHITARLTDVRQSAELWSNRYDGLISDASLIADDIASHTARAVANDRETVVESAPSPYPGGPRAARELVALGHQIDYYSPGPNPSTRQIYRLAWQFDKNDAVVLTHLANSDIRAGMSHGPKDGAALEEADTSLQQAIELDPTNVYTLFNVCVLRRAQERIPEAMEWCKRTLDIDPHHPGALRELGHDLMRSGDAVQAIAWYRASIDASPYLPYRSNAYKGLGVASLALGRLDDAIEYLRKSAELDVSSIDDELLWLAAVLEMDARHDEAVKILKQFVDLHPQLRFDEMRLWLLRAPAYAGCRQEVLAALASAGEGTKAAERLQSQIRE